MKTKVTGYLTQKHGFYYVVLNLPTDEKGRRDFSSLSIRKRFAGLRMENGERPDLRRGLRAYTKHGAWRQFARGSVSQA